jgi:hypothetical protein
MRVSLLRTALFAFSAALICPCLFAQTFSFAPPKSIPLPSLDVFGGADALDLNGDGKTDFVVDLFDGGYHAFLGDGKGGFSANSIRLILSAPSQTPVSPFWYDVNGDKLADAVLVFPSYVDPNGGFGYNGLFQVSLGDGKGNFTTTTSLLMPVGSVSYTVPGDFNKDGKLDFAVVTEGESGFSASTLSIFLNTGGGTFQMGETDTLGSTTPGQIVTGDFNGDGKLDLAWVDASPNGSSKNSYPIHYRYGNGNGTFGVDRNYSVDGVPYSLAVADFNHDGKSDLIAGVGTKLDASGNPVKGAQPRIATLLAKAAGGFSWSAATSFAGNNPVSLSLHDLNGDGLPDLVVNQVNYAAVYLVPGQPGGKFGARQALAVAGFPSTVTPLVPGGLPDILYVSYPDNSAVDLLINTSKK